MRDDVWNLDSAYIGWSAQYREYTSQGQGLVRIRLSEINGKLRFQLMLAIQEVLKWFPAQFHL